MEIDVRSVQTPVPKAHTCSGTDRDALGEPDTCISVRACHAISDMGVKSNHIRYSRYA